MMTYDPLDWYEIRYRVQGRDIEPTLRGILANAEGDVRQYRIHELEA